jgi:hypothetical protein
VGSQVEVCVQKAAIAADTAAVMTTPVDTGRARANWRTAIGAPVGLSAGAVKAQQVFGGKGAGKARRIAFQQALDEGVQVAGSWRLGMGSIFISNSVPYIGYLENGSSAQAPKGMTVHAIAAARKQLIGANLLKD